MKRCKCNTLKLMPVKSSLKVTVLPAHTHSKSLELSSHFSFFLKDCKGHFSEILSFFISQSSVHFLQLLIDSDISFRVVIAFCSFTQVHLAFLFRGLSWFNPSQQLNTTQLLAYHPATALEGESKKGKTHGLR